jgi:uracil-DNA glycosylase
MAVFPLDLQAFHASIKDGQNCALATGRTQVVCGDANPQAEMCL